MSDASLEGTPEDTTAPTGTPDPERLAEGRTPGAITTGIIMEDTGDGSGDLACSEAFWEIPVIADNERFDAIVLAGGQLLLRACPYSEDELRSVEFGQFHADDPEFTRNAHSHCGLTKWTCAGCGASSITETNCDFPVGWFEVSALDRRGDTEAFEAVCSFPCLVPLSEKAALRPVRMPGFGPETYPWT